MPAEGLVIGAHIRLSTQLIYLPRVQGQHTWRYDESRGLLINEDKTSRPRQPRFTGEAPHLHESGVDMACNYNYPGFWPNLKLQDFQVKPWEVEIVSLARKDHMTTEDVG